MAPALFGIELAVLLLVFFTTSATDYFLEFFIVYLVVCAIINIIAIIKLIVAWQKIFILHVLLLLIMPFGVFGLFWYALSNVRMC
jgi:hypothetical protein